MSQRTNGQNKVRFIASSDDEKQHVFLREEASRSRPMLGAVTREDAAELMLALQFDVDQLARCIKANDVKFAQTLAADLRDRAATLLEFLRTSQPSEDLSEAPTVTDSSPGALHILERGFACMMATQIIEVSCRPVGPDGEGWFDTASVHELAQADLTHAAIYLDLRGLLDRHPLELKWIRLRDQSRAKIERHSRH